MFLQTKLPESRYRKLFMRPRHYYFSSSSTKDFCVWFCKLCFRKDVCGLEIALWNRLYLNPEHRYSSHNDLLFLPFVDTLSTNPWYLQALPLCQKCSWVVTVMRSGIFFFFFSWSWSLSFPQRGFIYCYLVLHKICFSYMESWKLNCWYILIIFWKPRLSSSSLHAVTLCIHLLALNHISLAVFIKTIFNICLSSKNEYSVEADPVSDSVLQLQDAAQCLGHER